MDGCKKCGVVLKAVFVAVDNHNCCKLLEKPTFTDEPASTAGFVGGTARFTCRATAEPDVIRYEW